MAVYEKIKILFDSVDLKNLAKLPSFLLTFSNSSPVNTSIFYAITKNYWFIS